MTKFEKREKMKHKFFKHLAMVTKHRFKVFLLCTKCGLFWRGLVHDLSKFHPTEFFESVKYYTGKHSPISECREQNGHSKAWIHHKNRNKHHIEYWFDRENAVQMDMPYKYAVECVCDKIAAAKCYKGKAYNPEMVLSHWQKFGCLAATNDNMKNFFAKVFSDLAEHGEKFVLNKKFMKQQYKQLVSDAKKTDESTK